MSAPHHPLTPFVVSTAPILPPPQRNVHLDDPYDFFPPEILDHILIRLDHITLYNCTTLSRRWYYRVIPYLWRSPFVMYYVSWMKLLQTITWTSLNDQTAASSPDCSSVRPARRCRSREMDRVVVVDRVLTKTQPSPEIVHPCSTPRSSLQAPSSWPQARMGPLVQMQRDNALGISPAAATTIMTTVSPRDPWEGTAKSLAGFESSTVRKRRVRHQSDGDNGSHDIDNMDINNREDEEDRDLSNLLQLAESQRQDQDYVVRGGNCILEREVLTSSWSPRSVSMKRTSTAPNDRLRNLADLTFSKSDLSPFTCSPSALSVSPSLPTTPFKHPSYGALIQVFDFTHLHYIISDKFLTHLFPHTRNLLELYINSPKQFSDESLIALATSAPALRRLELVDCPKITDKGMSSILDHCHAIQHLVVSNGGASCLITDKSLSQLAHSAASQHTLRVLNLSNASPFITGQNPGLLSLAIWCRNLVSLNISHCSKMITDDFLEALRFGGSLQILNLAYCRDITDKGIIAMARSCPDLRELDIAGVNLITDKGILEIGLRCSLFQRLVIDDRFERVTEDVLRCFPWGAEVVQQRRMPK